MDSNSKDHDVYELTDEERFTVRKGMDAACDGNFAPDDEMETFYRCHYDRATDGVSRMEVSGPKR